MMRETLETMRKKEGLGGEPRKVKMKTIQAQRLAILLKHHR